MQRSYNFIFAQHIRQYRQMIFLTGPRQVGKTTLCQSISPDAHYLNWDNQDNRNSIIQGPEKIADITGIPQIHKTPLLIIFDEIHKYGKWKSFLKGFFDTYGEETKIIVTGSSRLDIFKKGGDSLMGRYFLYHLFPLTVREVTKPNIKTKLIQEPLLIDNNKFKNLYQFGGFPEPYLKAQTRFSNRWKRLRQQQFIKEDLRDFTMIQEIHQLEYLSELLHKQTGQLINYSSLSRKVNISVDTVKRWLTTLESIYYCFRVYPWSKNISRSLLKQPKIYLWDWSYITEKGAKTENLVACHLLKAVTWWTDIGIGEFNLFFLRDKDKREVDFLITKDKKPWFLVEVKESAKSLNKNLFYFQQITGSEHAFQLNFNIPNVLVNCFDKHKPIIVPAAAFLSQLV